MKAIVVVVSLLTLTSLIPVFAQDEEPEFTALEVSESFQDYWSVTDFTRSLVADSEISSGGVQRDGIPPYYPQGYAYPNYIPQIGGQSPRFNVEYTDAEATDTYLPDEQPIIAVEVEGEWRGYPLLLLNNHEIVNTTIQDVPIAVTFCPLCNASIVFEREYQDRVLHFGVSGMLRNSDLIMWDHETMSWWQQFTGQGIVGRLAGAQLTVLPSLVVDWGTFKREHPDALILANQGGYDPNSVSYAGYDERGPIEGFFNENRIDNRLPAMQRVLGYFNAAGAVAYPLNHLAELGVVNDVIGGEPLVVFYESGQASLFTNDLEVGSAGLYSATLKDGTQLRFTQSGGIISDEQTGSQWNVFGRAVSGELENTQLQKRIANPHFWFAWAAFRGDSVIWEPGQITDEMLAP